MANNIYYYLMNNPGGGGGTVDQTFDGSSTNAQSGVAIEGELTTNYQTKNQSVNTLSGTAITLTDNSVNTLTPTGNTTFTLPTVTDTSIFHQILIQLDLSTVYTIDLGATTYFGGTAPDLSQTGNYNLIYEYDNALSAWVVGSVVKGA